MNRIIALIAALVALTAAAPRAAADDWSRQDWVYGSLAAAAGGTVGALGGGLAGSLLDVDCDLGDTECVPAFTIAGLGAGLIIGSAYGATAYGRRRGLDGSYRSALIGSLLGNLASGSVAVLAAHTIDDGTIGLPIVMAAIIGLPAVGATMGYKRSAGHATKSEPTVGALLHVSPERVALGTPIVGLAVTPNETAVLVPLAGGTF
jgi:hypothetical protein